MIRGLSLDRWFSQRPGLAERACLALCAWTLMEHPGALPRDWRDMVRGQRVDQEAYGAAWSAWLKANPVKPGQHYRTQEVEATAPHRSGYLLPTWTREPPIPGSRRWFGDDWKAHPKNRCPVCARACYAGGDYRAEAGAPRWNKHWHGCCFAAHGVWRDASWAGLYLARRQGLVCPLTGERLVNDRGQLLGDVQVDHVVPLWRVRHDAPLYRWPAVLRFWGTGNLQALSLAGHRLKTAQEARERAGLRASNEDAKRDTAQPALAL